MSVVEFQTPAFSRRDPDMICWRVAAIYRCCLRLGMSRDWAISKLREISPEGHRDHMADLWFADIENVRRFRGAGGAGTQSSRAEPDLAMAA